MTIGVALLLAQIPKHHGGFFTKNIRIATEFASIERYTSRANYTVLYYYSLPDHINPQIYFLEYLHPPAFAQSKNHSGIEVCKRTQ